MEAIQVLAPLVGVVLGSALTGFGTYLRARIEHKRLIATALADLLEIRYQVVQLHSGVRGLLSKLKAPAEVIPHVLNFADSLVSTNKDLHERFEKSVSTLASVDPLLAFRVRAKNTLPHLLGTLRTFAITSGTDMALYERIESNLLKVVVPALDDAVLELARHHSWRTTRKIRSLISQANTIPDEFMSLLQDSLPKSSSAVDPASPPHS